jgi:anaerobic ribonucleoside-triphosphate reductase activating protein
MDVRVHRIYKNTGIAGPGYRYSLWVQGCERRCEGCLAPETWDIDGFAEIKSADEIIKSVRETEGIEGITFIGGEPFGQAKALAYIGKELREKGFSVVTFTGHTLEELREIDDEDFNALISVTDLLIDGAFQIDKKDLSRPWVGSSNQRFIFLTGRYNESDIHETGAKIEIRIDTEGKLLASGMGDFELLQKILK